MPLYATEAVFSFLAPDDLDRTGTPYIASGWMRLNATDKLVRQPEVVAARRGIPFDARNKIAVVRDLRRSGIDAFPSIPVPPLFRTAADNSMEPVLSIEGSPLVPLGGISQKRIVLCNETGLYAVYSSDEHGLNNPLGIWNTQNIDIAVLGDSFMEGQCVASDRTVSGMIRQRYGATLNLGRAGNGPLLELAGIREFLTHLQPRIVIWAYFEGNDLQDLFGRETRSSLLRNYLYPDFSQGLIGKQREIDRALIAHTEAVETLIDQGLNQREPLEVRFERFVKLGNLRERMDALSGKQPLSLLQGERLEFLSDSDHAALFRHILLEARNAVQSWNGQLIFLYLPQGSRYGNQAVTSKDRDRVLQLVEQLGIPIIDVHQVFSSAPDPLMYFPFHIPNVGGAGHYTEQGYEVIAHHILRCIEEFDLLNPITHRTTTCRSRAIDLQQGSQKGL
ncbi:MAG: hypothetical protein JSR62_03315 [Nitrospira sp.]|nr:hypothetical protein [Nitrospira sp.]